MTLDRRLGTGDAIVLGLGSMIGAGIFVAPTPAAEAAGSGVLVALALAAVVALCNALSSARLAALGLILLVYAAVLGASLAVLGPGGLAAADAPLTEAVRAADAEALVPLVRVGAAVGAAGALLALILGVSRTTLAMARDGHLPGGAGRHRGTRRRGCALLGP